MTPDDGAPVIAETLDQARAIKAAGGETFEQAVARIRMEAIALREQDNVPVAVFTEAGQRLTMIGVARPGGAAVLQVDVADYDGFALAKLLGFALDPPKQNPDAEAVRKAQRRI